MPSLATGTMCYSVRACLYPEVCFIWVLSLLCEQSDVQPHKSDSNFQAATPAPLFSVDEAELFNFSDDEVIVFLCVLNTAHKLKLVCAHSADVN